MTPQSQPRKSRNSSRVNLTIALGFHAVLVFVVLYFAAQNGLIGDRLKNLTVSMVKEPPPEKPKEPDKPAPQPEPEPPGEIRPKILVVAPSAPLAAPPPTAERPSALAPPPAELPSFTFDDGAQPVETATPASLYKNLVEYTLRANWDRPAGTTDTNCSAEVEIAVDGSGHITGEQWKRGSGDQRWDDSVRKAISSTRSVNRPPPPGFPAKVLVRFDTVGESEHVLQ
jgi:hypothetical protein